MIALGCLQMLSNELSLPALGIDQKRVEMLGRSFFTSKTNGVKSDLSDLIQVEDPTDRFWESHVLRFPCSWPEKVALPVTIADPSKLGQSAKCCRLLALDELVLAFWAFSGFAVDPACVRGLHCRAWLERPIAYAMSCTIAGLTV